MKKIFALVAVALIGLTSAFAFSVGEIQGTWKDNNWNANWSFSADTNGEGQIVLSDATTGEVIATFKESNVQNYNLSAGLSGVTISFYSSEWGRKYSFTKPISLGSSLTLNIDRDWTDEPYEVEIPYVDGGAGLN
ncbi:MAG TPA: hypothetical protein DCM57_02730 [Treponema sp.]|jgi:hypothetical protein|nr:hypothetical protein [Treponema sp.]